MNKEEIKKFVQKDLEEQINKVILGEIEEYNSDFATLDDVKSYLESVGFEEGEFDSNGWQWDFWQYMMNDKQENYIISGSGYYGGVSFKKDEDYE